MFTSYHISGSINRDSQKYFDNTVCILQILQYKFPIFELLLPWEMKVHSSILFFDDWVFPNPRKYFGLDWNRYASQILPWGFHMRQVGSLEWEEFGSVQSFWSFRGHAAHYRGDPAKKWNNFWFLVRYFRPFANFLRWYFGWIFLLTEKI